MRARRSPLLLLALAGSAAAVQDLSPEESVRRMRVPEGFEVTLTASEPQIRQPVTMSFDDRGRIWVLQYLQYPTPAGLKPVRVDDYLRTVYDRVPEPPPRGPRGADRITILEDRNGDGFYETAKDFVTGLNLASGLCLGRGGVFVAQPPYLLFYPDRDGDDVPDADPEVPLEGFGMEDAHAFANSLQWGPDGWLYGAHGSTVTARIRGIEFQQGIWRYHPVTKEFELYAEGGGNTWGLDFDRHGHALAGTNWSSFACLHQVQGGYYIKGFAKHGPLHNPYAFGYFDHVPYAGFKGGHVTCGGVLYLGGSFPPAFHDTYIAANPLSNAVHWHLLERKGSSFAARHGGELLVSDDPWFRPIDCLVGPDGALYVVDWYDARLNHVDPRDTWDRRNGRIYRVAPRGLPKPAPPLHEKRPTSELVRILAHPNAWHRREARRILSERRDAAAVGPLRELLSGTDDLALEALWTLYGMEAFGTLDLRALLSHPHEQVRAWTATFLGDRRTLPDGARELLTATAQRDPSPAVRSRLAQAARRLPPADALPVLRALLLRPEDADDPHIPLLLWWALEEKASAAPEETFRLFDDPAFWRAPIVHRAIVSRLARRFMVSANDPDAAWAARLLERAPGPPDVEAVLEGLEQALEGRVLERVPGILERALARREAEAKSSPALLRLSVRLGRPGAYARALAAASDPGVPAVERTRLVALLGQSGRADAAAALLSVLERASDAGLLVAVLEALANLPDPSGLRAALERYPRLPAAVRSRVRGLFFRRPASALEFLRHIDSGAIARSEAPFESLVELARSEDPEIRRLIEKHWGKVGTATPGEKRARISSLRVILARGQGDPARGRPIFARTCGACHTLFGEGGKIGPDLTGINRKDLESLLTNIVDPSALIRPEYQAQRVRTNDGQVLLGLLAEETPASITLVDAQNVRTVLPRARIEAMAASEVSLMPEKLLDPLTDQDVRDLFAYLRLEAPPQDPAPSSPPLRVCLVSGSLEYESDASLEALQEHLERNYNVKCTRAFRRTDEDLPGLENLESCDVMLLFTRRLKLQGESLERVKRYCLSGKPIVGIRTASHAFQTWLDLDREVFGGSYKGHYGKGPVCEVRFTDKARGHPILEGVREFSSQASLYRNPENAPDVDVLLTGTAGGKTEPVAWTRLYKGARIFYTSLGDQGDFKNEHFRRMIVNALFWTAGRTPERRQAKALPGTRPLEEEGDFAALMVEGIDRFLRREIEQSRERRAAFWKVDRSSPEAYEQSVAPKRDRLKKILGVVDERAPFAAPEVIHPLGQSPVLARSSAFEVLAVRWPVFRSVEGEGLLLVPTGRPPEATVILLPDADESPEEVSGLVPSTPPDRQPARSLAERGFRVVVPALIDRSDTHSISRIGKATNQPHREFVYRPAFELGRHILGYEVQKTLALVDWLHRETADPRVILLGFGEGGLLALYAGAIDPRIDEVRVHGAFGPLEETWKEPIYRNVFGLLREFGGAELAALVAPRPFAAFPEPRYSVAGPPPAKPGRSGAAPGSWTSPDASRLEAELARFRALAPGAPRPSGEATLPAPRSEAPVVLRRNHDPAARLQRQLDQLLEDTQHLLRRSEAVRDAAFWKRLRTGSLDDYAASTAPLRREFEEEVLGRFDRPLLAPDPRSRLIFNEPACEGYEVKLDVWPDVFAYGILLVPRDLKPGERRPAVVCQHGLEGRPRDLADPGVDHPAYRRFGVRLAERGFVVFAPQNPYLGRDAFRTLQRKANFLGTHLFSIIIPQHRAITDWLASLPFVDPDRIGFYGLSYGGKTAMRVPAVVPRYALSICSADFNEWIWKNAALDSPYSYVTTGEYEIFEWNLGNTFNYAEMAALIAPRPFMVERGHRDGVAPDERVAYEYAKVRRLYADLKIHERTEIEFFDGPHAIHGVGTFRFLHRHLKWPEPRPQGDTR